MTLTSYPTQEVPAAAAVEGAPAAAAGEGAPADPPKKKSRWGSKEVDPAVAPVDPAAAPVKKSRWGKKEEGADPNPKS